MSTATRERPRTRTGSNPPRRPRPAPRGAGSAALSAALVRARSGRRLSAILVLYVLLTAAIAWRLVDVQVLSADRYREAAVRQTQRELELPARRGQLVDREGQPFALSLTAATVYANPRMIADEGVDAGTIAAQLAEALRDSGAPGVDQATILGRLTLPDRGFEYIARQVPREAGQRVADLGLAGIGVLEEPTRVYPSAPLATALIGRAGTDHVGLSGLELQFDDELTGTPGVASFERANSSGLEITAAPREVLPPVPGTDVVLTLDREIQAAAEAALTRAVNEHQAEGGAAVVLDVATGEVLALASANGPASTPTDRNRAISDFYEPGSVNKVITISAALEEGLVTPSTLVTIPRAHTVGGKTFSDDHASPEGALPVSEVMVRSSNVGTIRIAEQLGPDRLREYAARFGYGEATGLDFPGEAAGLLPAVADWSGTSLPTIAIGHGVSATLLQVAQVYATVANGGEWVQPSLVRGTRTPDGELVAGEAPERRRVISEGTARAVAQMLGGVVSSEHGTGGAAAVAGYEVGGKTGTARKPLEGARGYEAGAYVGSFAGLGPIDDPRLVVAVMIDESRAGGYYGGQVAAPVFSEIMGFALGHERVPPSGTASEAPAPVPTPTPTPTPATDRP